MRRHLWLRLSLVVVTAVVLAACRRADVISDVTENESQIDTQQLDQVAESDDLSRPPERSLRLNPDQPPQPTNQPGLPPAANDDAAAQLGQQPVNASQAVMSTSKGTIIFELFTDRAPLTTANFAKLVREGFYDGIKFHRVIDDFMAQAGDPLTRDDSQRDRWGQGGPGYTIPDEFHPQLRHDSAGIVSMANRGPNTGGSQFFITYSATPWLDDKHAVFGKVIQGLDVLETITVGDQIIGIELR
ncbi:MAG: hypothetical protein COU69_00150 [Candidatus Pacebacteria bacterium CG10_big_fil_rev_8_21_14_0_10_56_10]|nr:MAG: hypothetical protein COU69_00150 [Candidatus Pacebacteria bacterium CG10_big_fil_rev_8_21_14_0_10_56_10]